MYDLKFLKLFQMCGITERKNRNPNIEWTAAVVLLYGRKKESTPEIESTIKLVASVRLTHTRSFIR
jgi:hypothetical protein